MGMVTSLEADVTLKPFNFLTKMACAWKMHRFFLINKSVKWVAMHSNTLTVESSEWIMYVHLREDSLFFQLRPAIGQG